MSVTDRLGFALNFLDDAKLLAFLKKLQLELLGAGELQGLLITGEGFQGGDEGFKGT